VNSPDIASLLEKVGLNSMPLPVRLRMTQFSTVRGLPLLNTVPVPLFTPIP